MSGIFDILFLNGVREICFKVTVENKNTPNKKVSFVG